MTKEYILEKLLQNREYIEQKYSVDKIGLFGSYAKDLQKKGSDLDVLVVGRYNRKKIREISEIFRVNISIMRYSPQIYKKLDDTLIREVIDNHIVIKGTEEFVDSVRNWTR